MADGQVNIAEDLRSFAYVIDQSKDKVRVVMLSGDLLIEAAEEIEILHKELARLKSCSKCAKRTKIMNKISYYKAIVQNKTKYYTDRWLNKNGY